MLARRCSNLRTHLPRPDCWLTDVASCWFPEFSWHQILSFHNYPAHLERLARHCSSAMDAEAVVVHLHRTQWTHHHVHFHGWFSLSRRSWWRRLEDPCFPAALMTWASRTAMGCCYTWDWINQAVLSAAR